MGKRFERRPLLTQGVGRIQPAAGVQIDGQMDQQIRKIRLVITSLLISLDADDDFGGTKICDLPDSNLLILGAEADLSLDKDAGFTAATGILTLTGDPLNNETVTIDSKVYTFQDTLTDVDGNVHIGATESDSLDNLIAAITLGAGAGTDYATSMTVHPTVTAEAGAGDTMDVTATVGGGNTIASTEELTNGSFGGATLSGGTDGILAATDVTVGVGTAVASNSTLSGAMIDVLTASLTDNVDPAIFQLHTNALGSPALTFVDDGAASSLFLNAAASITLDGSLTCSGTIDIYYIDTGNVTS